MTPPKFNSTNSQSRYSRTNRNGSRRGQNVARDISPSSKSNSGAEDGVKRIKNALSNLNFQGNEKDEMRKKRENVESGVESQDSNGHEISNSLGKACFVFSVVCIAGEKSSNI